MIEALPARVVERHENARQAAQRRVRPPPIHGTPRRDRPLGGSSPVQNRLFQSRQIVDDGREIDLARRTVAILAGGGRDLVDCGGVVERVHGRIHHPGDGREIHLEITAQDRRAGDRRQIVRRVPGRATAVAADRVIAAPAPLRQRDVRQQHVERRRTDLVERVVAGAERSHAGGRLADRVGNRLAAERSGFRHPHDFFVGGRIGAPGRVDVQVRDAPLVEVVGEMVRIPGGACVAAGRMSGPPRDPDAALQPPAGAVQHPRELDERRITHRVVADADVPRVVVTVDQQKLVGIFTAANLGHRDQARRPSLAQPRPDAHAGTAV